jgi:glycosyltransferase involved in cell wall biosynthesis
VDQEFVLTHNPLISVIIPTYNRATYVPAALESVWTQDYQPLEIIIIDDGSSDNTPEIMAGLDKRVTYVRQENQGPAAARNHGLQISHGEVIAFLDSDDLWPPGKLQLQLPYLFEPYQYDYIMGYTQFIRLPGGRPLHPIQERPGSSSNLGAGLYTRMVFDRVGGFDEGLRLGEDLDWQQRARSVNLKYTVIHEVTLIYQLHANNLTNDRFSARKYYWCMIRKSIDRNRNV